MERRCSIATEVRAAAGKKINGIAARYGVLSRSMPGGWKERIRRGAFGQAIRSGDDIKCLFNHDMSKILGSTKAGTLELRDTNTGLEFECSMPNTTIGNDTYESIRRGDLSAMSFSFALGSRSDEEWSDELDEEDDLAMPHTKNESRGRVKVRNLVNIPEVYDVSPVAMPAYPGTTVDARSFEMRSYLNSIEVVRPHFPTREAWLIRQFCWDHKENRVMNDAEMQATADILLRKFDEKFGVPRDVRASRRHLLQEVCDETFLN
jgi:HK97 family phage prohead protease